MDSRLRPLLLDQDGVVTRGQAVGAGLTDNDLARLRRRRQLVPLHRAST